MHSIIQHQTEFALILLVAWRIKSLCWVQMGLDWQLFHCPTLWRSLEPEKTHSFHHSYWLLGLQISPDLPPKMRHNPPMQCVQLGAAPGLKPAHVIPRRVQPHALALRSNDLFLSEPSAGWMETATDVRLSPEKPPIPTVTPFLAGQAHYWQDTEFQWSRPFDQSTHFWGVFACFMGVCSNLLSETHVQKLQMGPTLVLPQHGCVWNGCALADWEKFGRQISRVAQDHSWKWDIRVPI